MDDTIDHPHAFGSDDNDSDTAQERQEHVGAVLISIPSATKPRET